MLGKKPSSGRLHRQIGRKLLRSPELVEGLATLNEPIILPSIERARAWVDLCAKGLSVPVDKAASILATLCGFGSWDVMTYAMESMPPSLADEDLEPDQYRDRLKGQVRILVREHELDPAEAMMLLCQLPPSSREPYKALKMTDSVGFTELQMQAFMEYAGEFASEMSDEMQSGPLQSAVEDSALQDVELSRASIALALSGDTAPELWMHIFDFLEWEYEYHEDDRPDLDEPSYTIFDSSLGEIPVYLSCLAKAPGSRPKAPVDRAQRVQRALCVGDYVSNWQDRSSVALLLHRWPIVNEVNGKLYCHLGSVYQANKKTWMDLLFNRNCSSVTKLLKLNARMKDIQKGCPELVDTDEALTILSTICLSGIDIEDVDDFPDPGVWVERTQLPGSKWMMQKVAIDSNVDGS